MADTTQPPMNGNYPAQHAYPDYNHAHTAVTSVSNFQPAQSSTPTNAPPNDQKNGISKDEVGWYFVEQYYTNMSRSPEKLHLFYSRRSQLVFGTEAESVPVAVGQKAINEKFKQLDFQDCKVRVLNVDSQASFDNILISVIGEISNKSEPSRKFVQTFVLAEQPNGYYVLNDIFRYLVDEEEEIANEEAAPAEAPAAPEAPAKEQVAEAAEEPAAAEAAPEVAEAQVTDEAAAAQVDEKLEQVKENGEQSQINGAPAEEPEAPQDVPAPIEPEATQPEKTATPKPTPAEPVQKEAPAPEKETAAPAKAAPKTWASIASKPGAAAPVVPAIPVAAPKPTPAPAPSQPSPAPAPSQPAPTPASAPAPAAAESTPEQATSTDSAGWQTAGHDHKKTQSRAGEEQNVLAYIKNVNEKVDASLLKQTLSRFGKLKYFDVSRPKNCAFVEFADPAGYAAAVAANPHQVGSEQIFVEERRPRGNAYGGNANYGAGRGGAGRGRGDRAGNQGRGGFQREGRGGFAPRGRGGNVNGKPRNQPQAA